MNIEGINHPPIIAVSSVQQNSNTVALTHGAYNLLENTLADITFLATDSDGDLLVCTIASGPHGQSIISTSTSGSIQAWGQIVRGVASGSSIGVLYNPTTHYYGPDTSTLNCQDSSGASTVNTVTINIDNINDVPSIVAVRVADHPILPDPTTGRFLIPTTENSVVDVNLDVVDYDLLNTLVVSATMGILGSITFPSVIGP